MKGFTIKCNECGKEIFVIDKHDYVKAPIIFYIHGYGDIKTVKCDCGNEEIIN